MTGNKLQLGSAWSIPGRQLRLSGGAELYAWSPPVAAGVIKTHRRSGAFRLARLRGGSTRSARGGMLACRKATRA